MYMEERKLYVARDDNGTLWLHFEKPKYSRSLGGYVSYLAEQIPIELLPEVTIENSPQEVELKLKELCR